MICVSALYVVLMCTHFFVCKTFAYNDILQDDDIFERIDDYLRSCAENAHIPALTATIADSIVNFASSCTKEKITKTGIYLI